jgi:hypothetical protein
MKFSKNSSKPSSCLEQEQDLAARRRASVDYWRARQFGLAAGAEKTKRRTENIIPMPLPGEEDEWRHHYGKMVNGRVILPGSTTANVLDAIILALILYYAISVPLLYSFRTIPAPPEGLEIFFSLIFLFDVARNFVTAVDLKNGTLLIGYKVIAAQVVVTAVLFVF